MPSCAKTTQLPRRAYAPTLAARFLALICLASAGWAFSFGLGTQVTSHWLRAQGHGDTVIGLNHATYYLGLALASLAVPRLMARWGSACAPAGLVLSGVSLALFPWGGSLAGFLGLRLANGAAAGMSLIPLETFISRASGREWRTRNFGFYAVALTLFGAVGIWAGLHFYHSGQCLAFYLGSIAPFLVGLILVRWLPHVGLTSPRSPGEENRGITTPLDSTSGLRPDARQRQVLSFGTAWSQGFLEGGMLAFLSFFLMSLGLSADGAGQLMGVTMAGVILFQVPVSWLGDRLGKVPVLLGCYAVVIVSLLALPWCVPSVWLAVCLFLFGACSGAMYPLGLSLLGEGVAEAGLARLYAWYMAMECLGSQIGAAAMGKARDLWGQGAMFAVGLAAVLAVLLAWLIVGRIGRRRALTNLASPSERVAA